MSSRNYSKGTVGDMLREIGNIGCGNALNALSVLTDESYEIKLPDIELVDCAEVFTRLDGIEQMYVSIVINMDGDIRGKFLLLLNPSLACSLLKSLGLGSDDDYLNLTVESKSAILEVGNISCGSCITAVSTFTEMDINVTTPSSAVDMLGALLSQPILQFAETESDILYIRCDFSMASDPKKSGIMLVLPEMTCVDRLIDRFGAYLK